MQTLKLKKEYKKYPEYTDSGVEWLGKIPKNWETLKARKFISQIEPGIWGDDPKQNKDDIKCLRVADFDFDRLTNREVETIRNNPNIPKKKILKKCDILIEKSGGGEKQPVGRAILFDGDEMMTCANFIDIIRLKKEVLPRFFTYQLYAAYDSKLNLKSIKQNTGIQNLDIFSYFNEIYLIPELDQQSKIVKYLDEEISHIDQIIEKKQKLIELLREKRTAVINNAVTKGLDPKVEFIDSGIAWIEKIPKGWGIEKIKRVSQMNKKTLSENTDPNFSFKYFDIGSVDEEEASNAENEITFEKAPSRARRIVSPGDSIIATVRTYLKAIAYFDKLETNTVASTGFAVLTPGKNLLPKYLFYYLQSERFINQVILNSKGVGYPAITPFDLGSLEMIYPEKKDQELIVKYLDDKILKFNNILDKTEKSIELLNEFKSSLIFNVVTGKVKLDKDQFLL